MNRQSFEAALTKIPKGYSKGIFAGRRYGITLQRSKDGRRISLFALDVAVQQSMAVEVAHCAG